jgi:hypothetical protein
MADSSGATSRSTRSEALDGEHELAHASTFDTQREGMLISHRALASAPNSSEDRDRLATGSTNDEPSGRAADSGGINVPATPGLASGPEELISINHHSLGGGRLDLNKEMTRRARGVAGMPSLLPHHISSFPASPHIIVDILIVLVPVTGGTAVVQGAGARV